MAENEEKIYCDMPEVRKLMLLPKLDVLIFELH